MTDKNQTLLIIEDELSIRRFLKASLLSQKFKIVEAENGTEGLAFPRKTRVMSSTSFTGAKTSESRAEPA